MIFNTQRKLGVLSRKSEACHNCNLPMFGYILVAFNKAQKESDVAQFKHQQLSEAEHDKLDAAVFRQLLRHLDQHKEVQNIDLMILADFAATACVNGTLLKRKNRVGFEY